MRLFKCPKCGEQSTKGDRTFAVICPCGGWMELIKAEDVEITNSSASSPVNSPEIILRGEWPGKSIKRGKEE